MNKSERNLLRGILGYNVTVGGIAPAEIINHHSQRDLKAARTLSNTLLIRIYKAPSSTGDIQAYYAVAYKDGDLFSEKGWKECFVSEDLEIMEFSQQPSSFQNYRVHEDERSEQHVGIPTLSEQMEKAGY
jgi:hypothetical protein